MHLVVAMWNEERHVKRRRRTCAILADHAFISLICGGVVLERGQSDGIVTIQFPTADVVLW